MIDHHTALIYAMVLVSAADQDMSDAELGKIGEMVTYLPVFKDYDHNKLTSAAEDCAELLTKDDGLESALDLILAGLPEKLRETAYVLACDIAAADGKASNEELALVELIGERLEIEPLGMMFGLLASGVRAHRGEHAVEVVGVDPAAPEVSAVGRLRVREAEAPLPLR